MFCAAGSILNFFLVTCSVLNKEPVILAIRSSRRIPCFFRDLAHLISSRSFAVYPQRFSFVLASKQKTHVYSSNLK